MIPEQLFYPKSVAVFGSASEGKLANILIGRLLDGGMERVYAVNPKAASVRSAQGYESLAGVPAQVDLAVIAAPANTVRGILEDCGKCAVKAAVIISSGFSEVGNAAAEQEIMEEAKRWGIRFIGPNCAGMVCTQGQLVATLETAPPSGNISIISQSGAVGGAFMALSAKNGVGISKFLSYGNGGDLTVIELLRYLQDDEETKAIALYLETVPSGREFMETVARVSAVKPVVILKSGRTNSGQRAALSHTGSMAGADQVCDAAFRQCGAIRVETLQELFEVCKGFAMLPRVEGDQLVLVTNSGGPGVMTVDKAETCGLALPELSDGLKPKLQEFLPSFAGLRNPVDLTVEGTGEQYRQTIETVLGEYDCAVALYIGTPYLQAMPVAQGIASAAAASGKAVAAVMQVGSDIDESIEYLKNAGIPCFASGEDAAYVLSIMSAYEKNRQKMRGKSCFAAGEPAGHAFEGGRDRLLEPEAMTLLKENGIPVPPFAFARSEDDAAKMAAELGFPVVVKVVSPQIVHKSDVGGVMLNLKSEDEVRGAFRKMEEIGKGKEFKGIVIYPMLKSGREVILGLTNDPTFGPLIAFGMGGIYTEVLKDLTFRIAPIDETEAAAMIREIKMYPILRGVRGEAPSDLEELARAIAAFSRLPLRYPDIFEADLNPVFVYEKGVRVADARILGK